MKLATNEEGGAVSDELIRIYFEIAERLGEIRVIAEHEPLSNSLQAERRELRAMYITLSLHTIRNFYGKTNAK